MKPTKRIVLERIAIALEAIARELRICNQNWNAYRKRKP